jgi:hypothetical protein
MQNTVGRALNGDLLCFFNVGESLEHIGIIFFCIKPRPHEGVLLTKNQLEYDL